MRNVAVDVPKKEFLWMAAYIVPKLVSVNAAVPDVHVTHDAMGTYTPTPPPPHTITDAGFLNSVLVNRLDGPFPLSPQGRDDFYTPPEM